MIYVYGVVHDGALPRPALDGVDGDPVSTVAHDGIAALVSQAPERPRLRRAELFRHLRVLERACAETTVVPCAFGSVADSPAVLCDELLASRHEELLGLLGRLEGRVQLNVKAEHDEETVLREVLAEEPEIARLRARTKSRGAEAYHEQLALGELVAAAVAARRERDAARLLDALLDPAEDVAVETAAEHLVLKAAFLVRRAEVERFDHALETFARSQAGRLQLEVIGPVPPTAFASIGGD